MSPYFVRTHKVFEELRKRFDLVISGDVEEKEMITSIQPITDADAVLRVHKVHRATFSTASATKVTAYIPPAGKRQLIKGIEIKNNVGTATFTNLYLYHADYGYEIRLWNASATQPVILPMDAAFHPFWVTDKFAIKVDVQATGTSAYLLLIMEEEELGE